MDPWSKVYYSRHIREASMGVDGLLEVVPPSGRVPWKRLLEVPILKRRRRWYREEIGKKTSILGVSSASGINRQRGHPGGLPGIQEARLPPRPRHQGAWSPGGSHPSLFW